MPQFEQLKNPPIKEAVLWIRTSPVAGSSIPIAELVPRSVNEGFPNQRQQITLRAEFQTSEDGELPETNTAHSVIAELRDSEDGCRTVSIRRDGMSLSALHREYQSWDHFVAEFREVWKQYLDHNKPDTVTRLSTRFINEIIIPFDGDGRINLDIWFQELPKSPTGLPDRVSRFNQQISISIDEQTQVLINFLTAGIAEDGRSQVLILDIDVSINVDYETQSDDFWRHIDQLHELKNLAFFGSLTSEALESYR